MSELWRVKHKLEENLVIITKDAHITQTNKKQVWLFTWLVIEKHTESLTINNWHVIIVGGYYLLVCQHFLKVGCILRNRCYGFYLQQLIDRPG